MSLRNHPMERGAVVRATVMVGEVETSYRRLGHGRSVIVLDDRRDEALGEALALLAAHARVIVPDRTTIFALTTPVSNGETRFAHWLRGFLEGIGVTSAAIVAPAALAEELSTFTFANPGTLVTVVLRGCTRLPRFRWDVAVHQVTSDADNNVLAAALFPLQDGGAGEEPG